MIGFFIVALSACTKDETEVSTVNGVPMTIETIDEDITVVESEQLITVNFTLSQDQIIDTRVAITIDAAKTTATEHVDFDLLTSEVRIDAYNRTGSFDVQLYSDFLAEGNETVAFIVGSGNTPFGPTNTKEFEINVTDFVDNNSLALTFDWEGIGLYDGVGYSLCENVDLDVYVLDTDGNDLGIYDGATAACPEVIVIDETWDDGTYVFASNMWDNGFAGLMSNNDFPITTSIDKPGVYNFKYVSPDFWTSEDLDQANDGNASFKALITVIKTGNSYKVYEADGTTLIVEG